MPAAAAAATEEAWGFLRTVLDDLAQVVRDTGGRPRGFVVLRWLDNPRAPAVETRVVRYDA